MVYKNYRDWNILQKKDIRTIIWGTNEYKSMRNRRLSQYTNYGKVKRNVKMIDIGIFSEER